MATAFDTFDQYALGHYDGQIEDRSHADVVSWLATGSAIGYGLAVHYTGDKEAALPTDSEASNGITVRETVRDNAAGDNPDVEYDQDTEMSVLRVGRVWVTVDSGAAVGDTVYVVPDTGRISNTDDSGTNIEFVGASFLTAASAGDRALIQLNGN